jgi:hypothetical protein
MEKEKRLYFRDLFRNARATALRDAEGFQEILFAIERLGSYLKRERAGLKAYEPFIASVVSESPLADDVAPTQHGLHTEFLTLYDLVKDGRNAALHEGSFARQLTQHAVELALVIEHGLTNGMALVGDFAVHNPICASAWHPISFIRQTLLANSFSHLPMEVSENGTSRWALVSDLAVARFLRGATSKNDLKERLAQTIGEAIAKHGFELSYPLACPPTTPISDALSQCGRLPVLVVAPGSNKLLGIATPFDLL